MGVEGGAAPRLQQVRNAESWSVVCNHPSLTTTPPRPRPAASLLLTVSGGVGLVDKSG